jgi:hypothetical protein
MILWLCNVALELEVEVLGCLSLMIRLSVRPSQTRLTFSLQPPGRMEPREFRGLFYCFLMLDSSKPASRTRTVDLSALSQGEPSKRS